jgi:hypothetical protein
LAMICKSIATALKLGLVAILLFTLLFADGILRKTPGFFGSIITEITAVFRDPSTQWMVVLCLACYFILFLILERRLSPHDRLWQLGNANLWLSTSLALVLLRYAFAYQAASRSMQVCILLGGIVCGKAVSAWVCWRNGHVERHTAWFVSLLICFLACSALWQPEMTRAFQYHGITRWSGVWDNPNLFGLLMGTGVVLAVGQTLQVRGWKMENGEWKRVLCVLLCSFAAILTGFGLFKSYSRGAWLGTALGTAYLIWNSGFRIQDSWLKANRLSLIVIVSSVLILCFWQFRFSEARPVQRAFSAANANDFSWRNRVAAWNGATHMMVDRPLVGFGWGQAESAYGKNYLPPQLTESAAIEMNDYFMLGISAGVPALVCFIAYVWLCFREKKETGWKRCPTLIYRAGAIVLLVGFLFDGGLFKLPVATVFWMLMELSRVETGGRSQESGVRIQKSEVRTSHWLRWAACFLASIALLQTVVYWGTPFLPISKGTLTIARKCLVPPKAIGDFDFLSANPIWRGQKLKVLLEHVELANYNRSLVNWQLDDKMYQDYILSPIIRPSTLNLQPPTDLHWRRALWENFYPRIRKESDPEAAAQIVRQQLHQRITISKNAPLTIEEMWRQQTADAKDFEVLCVAAFRSVGIPARLNADGQAEFFSNGKWQSAPAPAL